jgi:predicted GIY-YIG superfamily endonuclease
MNWKEVQKLSDEILAVGIEKLLKHNPVSFSEINLKTYGNYLIRNPKSKLSYIGESKDVAKRIKQHSKEKTSTFYKGYLKAKSKNLAYPQNLKIDDFTVGSLPNLFGRKEIEEFGIVNVPCRLNSFQKGKRDRFKGEPLMEEWTLIQKEFSRLLKEGRKAFEKVSLSNWHDLSIDVFPGIYWVEHKKDGLIYIGESSNVKDRYNTHSKTTYFSAFRRNLGENILGFKLQTIKGKKRYFSESEEVKLNAYLTNLEIKTMAVSIGRYELEEYLIEVHQPKLNRKGRKK